MWILLWILLKRCWNCRLQFPLSWSEMWHPILVQFIVVSCKHYTEGGSGEGLGFPRDHPQIYVVYEWWLCNKRSWWFPRGNFLFLHESWRRDFREPTRGVKTEKPRGKENWLPISNFLKPSCGLIRRVRYKILTPLQSPHHYLHLRRLRKCRLLSFL